MTLYERLSKIESTNPYFGKDLSKAKKANKFIGRGSILSSTNKYMVAAGELANCGVYEATDVVFVSVEGARRNRIALNKEEVEKAIAAGVTFVSDDYYNRMRTYNVGERELAVLLQSHGYKDMNGVWKKT